ncbi:MAG TPA: TonB-dependent receptor plug domain-containing protein [Longimicrobium sp.]|jgi:TonB-dependent SusC/RagA subfamily outer membrane receptor
MSHREKVALARMAALVALALAAGCGRARPNAAPEPEPGARPERSSASGGGQAVSEEDLKNSRVARAEELLEGRFAGVQVFRRPDGGIAVRIRGTTSVYGDAEPLYVVDGMPVNAGPGGALNGINPYDIVRIEVLKDIGSTSAYGMRGANGVVLITTRRP